jgi:hypothetical protein
MSTVLTHLRNRFPPLTRKEDSKGDTTTTGCIFYNPECQSLEKLPTHHSEKHENRRNCFYTAIILDVRIYLSCISPPQKDSLPSQDKQKMVKLIRP